MARDPYDVKLSEEQRKHLALWLARELDHALQARSAQDAEVDYWHALYEQARTRSARTIPWPDAADLTSYIATEKVDALHARIMRTVFTEPVWTVEGWGDSVQRAPFVEEFHQAKVEEERFQGVADRWLLSALIEPRGLLEISEGYDLAATTRHTMKAKLVTDPATGGPVFGEDAQPILERDDEGQLIEALAGDAAAEAVIDEQDAQRTGPQYCVVPYRDSVIMPGHARDKRQIWGYGKKFTKRLFELQAQAKGAQAIYDTATVDLLTSTGDPEPDAALQRSLQTVAPQGDHLTAEKELWELLVKIDLAVLCEMHGLSVPKGAKGLRWYVATIHKDQQLLLRLQHDDVDSCRFVPLILFPRPDRATEGFSFIGHKLITVIEEHTAWRNMAADKGSMVVQTPIKRQVGALWDPVEQPWGPKAVIDVRNMQEIDPVVIGDVPQSAFTHMQMQERNAERLAGINDIASGQVSDEDRTLGEVNMATEQSFVRMDLIKHRMDEAMEDVAQIRHAIWKRALAEKTAGVPAPQSLIVGMEGRGLPIEGDGKITADMLEGSFRFKPHGSVETADVSKQRRDFVQAIQFLPALLQTFPMLIPLFQTEQAARAIARSFLHLFKLGSQQAFLGSASEGMPGMGMGLPGMGMGGLPPIPGMPPGMMGALGGLGGPAPPPGPPPAPPGMPPGMPMPPMVPQ